MKRTAVAVGVIATSFCLAATPAFSATKTTKKAAPKTTKRVTPTTKSAAASTTAAAALPTVAPTTAPAPASSGDVDPNGVLRLGTALLQNTNTIGFDLTKIPNPANPQHALVYDTLLRWNTDGTFSPGLAKSAKVEGDRTVSIELQPNVKFSDGTPFDAAAVKFGLERNAAATNVGANSNEIRAIDSVTVDNPLRVTVRLKTPIAGYWFQLLSRGETMIVSPTAVQKGQDINLRPVGAGPFLVESIEPERKVRLVKNPNYFQSDRVKLAAVEYIHVADPTAMANALLSGQIDAADAIQLPTERALRGQKGMNVLVQPSEATNLWGQLCKSTGPLADQRVRQALNYGVDREAVNRIVYEGKGEVMDALVPKSNKDLYDPRYKDYYKRDIDKAKKLLADAGYPNGLRLEFFYTAGDSQTTSEIVQQQWKDIGVTVDLAQSTNVLTDIFVPPPNNPKRPGHIFGLQRTGIDKITRNLQPGSIGNLCNYNDEELNKVIENIRAKPLDDPSSKRDWNIMTDIVLEKALNVFIAFGVSRNAYSDKVGNPQFSLNFQGVPFLDIPNVHKKR